ncbi:MAG: L-threonylcarbamoyladenylate synthase [Patescibacteria group bacterium]
MEILQLTINNPQQLDESQTNEERDIVDNAVKCLLSGGLIIYPTETVYGIGADAENPQAVAKLLRYKERREGKPLSIAVTNQDMAEKYVELNQQARNIYRKFLPGPFTVVSKNLGRVAPGVASEFNTLGVRIPSHRLILAIVKKLGHAITATSANPSGEKNPYTLDDIFCKLSERQKRLVDLAIDAGTLPHNQPSTVIDTTLSTPITLRKGDRDILDPEMQEKMSLLDDTTRPGTTSLANGANAQLRNSATSSFSLPSASESDTQGIAGRLLLKHWNELRKSGLIIGLDGPLGAGKTIFAKGIAQFLGIEENIVSPTYSYINEYDFLRHQVPGKLFHLDVWKIDTAEQFILLEFDKMLAPNHLILIEWWDQIKPFIPVSMMSNQAIKNLIEIEIRPQKNNLSNPANNRLLIIKEPKT